MSDLAHISPLAWIVLGAGVLAIVALIGYWLVPLLWQDRNRPEPEQFTHDVPPQDIRARHWHVSDPADHPETFRRPPP